MRLRSLSQWWSWNLDQGSLIQKPTLLTPKLPFLSPVPKEDHLPIVARRDEDGVY